MIPSDVKWLVQRGAKVEIETKMGESVRLLPTMNTNPKGQTVSREPAQTAVGR